jgi:hypothetical protein
MSIEDSAGADARRRMLAHTMHNVSGSLKATWPVFGLIVAHPNEWVRGCVQQARSGRGNTVTSGKPGLGDKPVVQAGQRLVSLGPRDVSEGPDTPLGSWGARTASRVGDQGCVTSPWSGTAWGCLAVCWRRPRRRGDVSDDSDMFFDVGNA